MRWIDRVETVDISIHAPAKGATLHLYRSSNPQHIFQSTLPRRERRAYINSCGSRLRNFNPRSHEGSDPRAASAQTLLTEISIHAPTKGATDHLEQVVDNLHFNPRSHEGSDITYSIALIQRMNFNPRSHEGSDAEARGHIKKQNISIHAPTKGATSTCCNTNFHKSISIHAPTKGATSSVLTWPCHSWVFQSTLPRRERLPLRVVCNLDFTFQSTLPRRERRRGRVGAYAP